MGEGASFDVVRDTASAVVPTTGELFVEGLHFCYTLELPWLNNEPNLSCIPTGKYDVQLLPSKRRGFPVPHILNVPNRTEIEIHFGNFVTDTEGCILLGDKQIGEDLLNSRIAFDRFLEWFNSVGNTATLTISNATVPLQMQTT